MKTVDAKQVIDQLGLAYFHELSTFGALSDKAIVALLNQGEITQWKKGETEDVSTPALSDFYVVLQGDIAYYRHCEDHDVLTRHFRSGEQMAFDVMISMRPNAGIEVASEDSLVLTISSDQFFQFHVDFPSDFGLLMINLSRELSREIAMLEQVIGDSTGWVSEDKGSEAEL